tara:strand:+ start:1582 stop:2319 length:738 start_codon:yes stop_codon:yes gene_type:complete
MVSIDTVYQRVLSIANKEQRGYITPQEYNLLANQAQMMIFEQYFYDLSQFEEVLQRKNDTTYADMIDIINEKIDHFEKFRQPVSMGNLGVGTLPDYYRMGELYTDKCGRDAEIEKINQNNIHHILNSPLTNPTETFPVYVRYSDANDTDTKRERQIQIYPKTIGGSDNVVCNYIARPKKVEWGYTVVNEKAMYNASRSQDFELHQSEEKNLVVKILELSGILLKDPALYQLASAEEQQQITQEKS